jgi:hypothetical protein
MDNTVSRPFMRKIYVNCHITYEIHVKCNKNLIALIKNGHFHLVCVWRNKLVPQDDWNAMECKQELSYHQHHARLRFETL